MTCKKQEKAPSKETKISSAPDLAITQILTSGREFKIIIIHMLTGAILEKVNHIQR